MAQFLRPDGDVLNPGTGTFADIDESVASDADFVFSANGASDTYEFSFSDIADPQSSSTHTLRYRIAKVNAGAINNAGNSVTCVVDLVQGGSVLATDASRTCTGTWTTYSFAISTAQADAITDYSDLRIRFTFTTSGGGSPSNRRGGAISWAEFETPDPPPPNPPEQGFAMGLGASY